MKLYVETPRIEINGDIYNEKLLPIIQMYIANEVSNNQEWYFKYNEIAQEIFRNVLKRIDDETKTAEAIKHIDFLSPPHHLIK